MRHLRFVLCALFVLVSLAAYADSIPVFKITSASIFFFREMDEIAFDFQGPGISITGLGFFDCPSGWCVNHFVASGTPMDFGNFVPVQLSAFTIQIGGVTYSNPQAVLGVWTLNPSTAMSVPDSQATATFNGNGLIPGSINTANGTVQFEIKVPAGTYQLDWIQSDQNPSDYIPDGGLFRAFGSPVPEPSSVVFLVTGLAGILGTLKFKQRH
jgi:hypothetical protein